MHLNSKNLISGNFAEPVMKKCFEFLETSKKIINIYCIMKVSPKNILRYLIKSAYLKIALFYKRQKQNIFYQSQHISIGREVVTSNVKLCAYTNIAQHAQIVNSVIGMRSSIGRYATIRDTNMGSYCSISWYVTVGASSHPMERASSHAFTYRKQFGIVKKDQSLRHMRTTIGNDVWIGCSAVILEGIEIGDGAVIGAGAIVTHNTPPYATLLASLQRLLRDVK
jgi:acetyltransferase-like isoleucine patch superfamily enzyme